MNIWKMKHIAETINPKLTKLLLNLSTVEIKIFQRIHHLAVPFTTSTHIISEEKEDSEWI